ncbi:hypothetical protein EYF80_054165 [Liparis tanakae]|uniref:Uncharacterized protein n=1 Tax=Liparis tanakae TaxID=230148 RepID=A0A4Z2F461_9TELE|nr:hypothetical protein EYF80_054165 [Liparis tanakae]
MQGIRASELQGARASGFRASGFRASGFRALRRTSLKNRVKTKENHVPQSRVLVRESANQLLSKTLLCLRGSIGPNETS